MYDDLLKVQVKPWRRYGIHLSVLQIAAIEPTEDRLSSYGLGTTFQVSIISGGSMKTPLLPDLYDARLVTLSESKLLLSGIHRTADPREAQFMQEWSVLMLPIIVDADGLPARARPSPS